ncbi:translation initiation factor IF-3 [Roseibium sp.]|uniref:translation initiation factor IF-3 n=1 Tax=Roseibium sp. TaxID=1936156 RepID=UPI003A973415
MEGGHFLLQLIKITCGFIAAVLASGVFLAWGLFQASGPSEDPVAFAAMTGTALVTASVLGGYVMVPAFIAIGIAESLSLRSLVYHVGVAGLIALVLWSADVNTEGTGIRPGTTIALAAGFLGGFVYWLFAGRSAGNWRRRERVRNVDEGREV